MFGKDSWEDYKKEEKKQVMDFADDYKKFLSKGKTERECVKLSIELAEKNGFKDISKYNYLKAGDKVYITNKGKNIALVIMGQKPIEEGIHVLGAHIDSPRLDLKQNPLYEKTGFALFDTHYYGGIKKYQWVTIPLAMYGVVCKKDGTTVDINIGDNKNDPVFGVSDLLIHLSSEQMTKPGTKLIEGEALDLIVGSIPLKDKDSDKDPVKNNILKILNKKYGIEEEDFLSAEIEIVPAGEARDYGLDSSMIAGYGHDDRSCAYSSIRALIDQGECEYTTVAVLVDKEEIGSVGATGAQSKWFENTIAELINLTDTYTDLKLRHAMQNTKMLSSDVSAGIDPIYTSVSDKENAAYLGNGICFNKYTGARGKSGCNDAMPEYFAKIRRILDDGNCHYQTAELGKVDQGGGGTIAYILGNYNMYVIDAGIAVLNMHAPMEIISKADLYEAYKSYKVFLKNI